MRLISLNLWRGEQELEAREFLEKNLEQTDIFCFQEAQEAEALLSEILSRHGFLMKEGVKNAFERFKLRTYTRKNIEVMSVHTIRSGIYNGGLV